MADYIEKEKYIRYLSSRKAEFVDDFGIGWNAGIDAAIMACDKFPSSDVAPVRHGRWERIGIRGRKNLPIYPCCSACGIESLRLPWEWQQVEWKYCPNCGAKMDGAE